jgi:hypothetical protein
LPCTFKYLDSIFSTARRERKKGGTTEVAAAPLLSHQNSFRSVILKFYYRKFTLAEKPFV